MEKESTALERLIAPILGEFGETFLTTDVWNRLVASHSGQTLDEALEATAAEPAVRRRTSFSRVMNKLMRGKDTVDPDSLVVDALGSLGCQSLEHTTVVVDGKEEITRMWGHPRCTWHDQRKPCPTCEAEKDEGEKWRRGLARLRVATDESEIEDDEAEIEETGPLSRGLMVIDRRLATLKVPLQTRNITVIVDSVDDIDEDKQVWLLAHRVLVVDDEAPFVEDASSFEYGIVSVRLLSNREPKHVAKIISDAFVRRKLWNRRHGWQLLLRDDGEHKYAALVD